MIVEISLVRIIEAFDTESNAIQAYIKIIARFAMVVWLIRHNEASAHIAESGFLFGWNRRKPKTEVTLADLKARDLSPLLHKADDFGTPGLRRPPG
jgi:hypothetical protein